MYLIGDIGNTDIKICIFDKNCKAVKKLILKTNLISNKYLASNLNFLTKYSGKINIILFSSVVPPIYSVIKKFLKNKLKQKCIELKQLNLNKLVKIMVNKKQVGSDRISNAIGIINKKSNYIILDFGTATTFDVVIKDKYLGGVIAPGVNLSLKTLISKASLIPPVNLSKISKIVGTNTSSAVKSGFYWGYAGLIDNVIKLIIKQTNKPFKIILTGGLANLYKNTIKGKIEVKKDLTLNGLLKVAKNLK
tara:strand:- start:364 stop:1110 length:747 start_codon:yes stop_codon:yes gene_type:complete